MAVFDRCTGERLDPETSTPGLRLTSTLPDHKPSPGRVKSDQDGNVMPPEPEPETDPEPEPPPAAGSAA